MAIAMTQAHSIPYPKSLPMVINSVLVRIPGQER